MTTSQSNEAEVNRLRELLFGQEKRVLSDIEQLVLKHEERVGSDDALQHTVANIIADALKEAEVNNHRELAEAISPVVVLGIKREIRNSRDEMVEAFYPILGRLVSAYVSNAFREFIEGTNRRLEGSLTGRFIRLRIKSLFTRTPYRQLVLREARSLRIEELFLIKKGSGKLIDHWQTDPAGRSEQDEQLLSSLLSAVNEFAREAFAGGVEELRSLDIGASRIFLRASSTHLLVVKTTGYSGRRMERLLDQEMLSILESYGDKLQADDSPDNRRTLKGILPSLAERINSLLAKYKRPPVLAYMFLSMIALLAFSTAGWYYWDNNQTAKLRDKVQTTIAKYEDLKGFPITVNVSSDRRKVVLAGLSPTMVASQKLIEDLKAQISPATLETTFSHVPTLSAVTEEQQKVTKRLKSINATLTDIERDLQTTATASGLRMTAKKLDEITIKLKALTKASATVNEVELLRKTVGGLVARWDHPRRRVREWVRSHAIFFGDEDEIRDPKLASQLLKDLSIVLMASDAKLRVIGYTDPTGTPHGNVALAVKRANKIVAELKRYGVPASRLKPLGRPNGLLLSYDKGPNSSNRRVEFELIYKEETVESQGEPLEIKPGQGEE